MMTLALLLALQSDTIVESEKAPDKVERGKGLRTGSYVPREKEKPFFEKLANEEKTNGSMFGDYAIKGKKAGTAVSWFGIVRRVTKPDKAKDEFELLVDHKYFDGLTDTHIMTTSCYGGGDFKVRVRGKTPPVARTLALVRVYGRVVEEKDGATVLDADYVRVFPWRTFCFLMAYGEDRTNPDWTKLRKVKVDDIYDPYPDDAYFEDRLGKAEDVKIP